MASARAAVPRAMSTRRAPLVLAVYAAAIATIIGLADTGHLHTALLRAVPFGDKIGHFVLFGLFGLLADVALRRRDVGRRAVPLGPALVLAAALVEELSQIFVATRTFDLVDFAADVLGVTLFTLLGRRLAPPLPAAGTTGQDRA